MLRDFWIEGRSNTTRLEKFHRNMRINGRYLALPIDIYRNKSLLSFGASNNAWIKAALKLAESVVCRLLSEARVEAEAIAQLMVTTVTGLAVPSLDARLMNLIPFSPTLKRVPLFGLGCAGGAAGVARLNDYLEGHPEEAAILLSVELCSLTLQPQDLSIANIVSSGLFGDGAAAVLMVGDNHPLADAGRPRVVGSRSVFFPGTERVLGWDIVDTGFKMVLNAAVPELTRTHLRPAVEAFLAQHELALDDIEQWIIHPGGVKVLEAVEEGLGLDGGALHFSRQSLAEVGNVSSASVLIILQDILKSAHPLPGAYGLMIAMGPAFCAELVLLQW